MTERAGQCWVRLCRGGGGGWVRRGEIEASVDWRALSPFSSSPLGLPLQPRQVTRRHGEPRPPRRCFDLLVSSRRHGRRKTRRLSAFPWARTPRLALIFWSSASVTASQSHRFFTLRHNRTASARHGRSRRVTSSTAATQNGANVPRRVGLASFSGRMCDCTAGVLAVASLSLAYPSLLHPTLCASHSLLSPSLPFLSCPSLPQPPPISPGGAAGHLDHDPQGSSLSSVSPFTPSPFPLPVQAGQYPHVNSPQGRLLMTRIDELSADFTSFFSIFKIFSAKISWEKIITFSSLIVKLPFIS